MRTALFGVFRSVLEQILRGSTKIKNDITCKFASWLVNFRRQKFRRHRSPRNPFSLGGLATPVVDLTTGVVFIARMKAFPISTRYTAEELKQLDATAKLCKMSRAEVIHSRSLGKILTTHELGDWAEAEMAKSAGRKISRGNRAA